MNPVRYTEGEIVITDKNSSCPRQTSRWSALWSANTLSNGVNAKRHAQGVPLARRNIRVEQLPKFTLFIKAIFYFIIKRATDAHYWAFVLAKKNTNKQGEPNKMKNKNLLSPLPECTADSSLIRLIREIRGFLSLDFSSYIER